MSKVSRRSLARFAADELVAGKKPPLVAKQLVAALLEAGQLNTVDFLLSDIAWELEQRQILAIGKVSSANPLTKTLESALRSQILKATKAKEILLEHQIDKSLVGGLKVETSGRVWDMSVSHELAKLREAF